jgi:hypothetical protein
MAVATQTQTKVNGATPPWAGTPAKKKPITSPKGGSKAAAKKKAVAKKPATAKAKTATKSPAKAAAKKTTATKAKTTAKRPVKAAAKKTTAPKAKTTAKRPVRAAAKKTTATKAKTTARRTPPRTIRTKRLSAEMIKHAVMVGQTSGGHVGQGFTRLCRDWAMQIKQSKTLDSAGRQYLDMFVKMANWLEVQERRAQAR